MKLEDIQEPVTKDSLKTSKEKPLSLYSKSTLFVSTLPFTATNEELESFFSQIGPVRSCFVIKDKESGQHKGCGYVQYALPQDADKALEQLKKVKFQDKRTLKIQYAVKRKVLNERKSGINFIVEFILICFYRGNAIGSRGGDQGPKSLRVHEEKAQGYRDHI